MEELARGSLLEINITTRGRLTVRSTHESKAILFSGVVLMLMSVLSKVAARFVRDQRGATMVEYGLLVALIAVVVLTAVGALGTTITGMFTSVNDGL